MPPDPPVVLRTGPWRGAALLTGSAWRLLHGARLVLGLRDDPYAVGLAGEVPVTLVDGVEDLAARLADADGTTGAAEALLADTDATTGTAEARLADTDHAGSVVVLDSGHLAELTAYLDQHAGLGAVVAGEPQITGLGLLDVVAVMDRLRSPGGCPWDAEQTHASLRPYLLEEAQEAAEAIDSGDLTHLAEELGDVLLQVVFHARLGREDAREPFDVDDVAAGLVAKLVRRHPHVFGDVVAHTPEQVAANWERIKAAEKAP